MLQAWLRNSPAVHHEPCHHAVYRHIWGLVALEAPNHQVVQLCLLLSPWLLADDDMLAGCWSARYLAAVPGTIRVTLPGHRVNIQVWRTLWMDQVHGTTVPVP